MTIGWTGRYVVNDRITTDDVEQWTAVMGREPLLWGETFRKLAPYCLREGLRSCAPPSPSWLWPRLCAGFYKEREPNTRVGQLGL